MKACYFREDKTAGRFGCDESPATIFGRQISAAKFVK